MSDRPDNGDRIEVTYDSKYASDRQTIRGVVTQSDRLSSEAWMIVVETDDSRALRFDSNAFGVTVSTVTVSGVRRVIGECALDDIEVLNDE